MKKIFLGLFVLASFYCQDLSAQKISGAAHGGFGLPKGSLYKTDIENSSFGLGFCYGADLLYHMPKFDEKLGLGATYNGSIIFGAKSSDTGSGGGIYSLELYGIKVNYQFLNKSFSPYLSLSTGLSKFNHGGFGISTQSIDAGFKRSFSFGLLPEVGLNFGMVYLGASYYVPMRYKSFTTDKPSVGALQFFIGMRYGYSFKK